MTSSFRSLGQRLKPKQLTLFTLIAVVLPALISLFGIAQRHRVEAQNRAVCLATEIENIENLAAAQGITLDAATEQLKKRGLNGVVLSEETLNDLLDRGEAVLEQNYAENPTGEPGADIPVLRFSDPRSIERVQRGLRIRFGELATNLPVRQDRLLLPAVSLSLIRSTPIGLNPADAAMAKRFELVQISRFNNILGTNPASVTATLAWGKELGTAVFLPAGDQVLGRRGAINTTAEALEQLHLYYASAEFGKIGGDANMLQLVPERVIRLHAAQSAELDKMSDLDAVERYTKAARERNMRILLIRPLSNGGQSPIGDFGNFIGNVAKGLVDDGATIAVPHGFRDTALPRFYFPILALSIVPAAYLVLVGFGASRLLTKVLTGLFALGAIGAWSPGLREPMALLGSMVFPVLAYIVLEQKKLSHPALDFGLVTAISVVGGLIVAAMLNGLSYFIGANLPLGVKVSIFLPILIVGLFLLIKLADLKTVLQQPITWGSAVLFIGVGGVLAMLIARSGNDSGVGVSSTELLFRNLLDRYLYVRPRTKEFMVGHPALIIGLGLLGMIRQNPALKAKLNGWACLALMLGVVGQTGMVNTLWHLHIPVVLSLARIGIGAVLGCTIGLAVWTALRLFLKPLATEAK